MNKDFIVRTIFILTLLMLPFGWFTGDALLEYGIQTYIRAKFDNTNMVNIVYYDIKYKLLGIFQSQIETDSQDYLFDNASPKTVGFAPDDNTEQLSNVIVTPTPSSTSIPIEVEELISKCNRSKYKTDLPIFSEENSEGSMFCNILVQKIIYIPLIK